MKYNFKSMVIAACAAVTIVSCGSKNDVIMPDDPNEGQKEEQEEKVEGRNELYRPQVHYTPAKNWMNDPNGMVYLDGTWHLFYQYNPYDNVWGNMSWGHATSKDLMHWNEQSVALVKDALGDIFSGSAVIDHDNTAGFGKEAMVCLYTSAGEKQQQSMAYSTDGGKSFKTYTSNPIIANTDKDDFRDPKVFWHEQSQQWIMSLARGWTKAIDFYASKNLKSWTYLSSFSAPEFPQCNKGQWECPDLIQLPVEDAANTERSRKVNGKSVNGNYKWVLIVSTNPGGPILGSGTMYFVGDFDGTSFTADSYNYPLWLDYGLDNYAGVTWSNTPDDRKVFIGWMNNWSYCGDVPCKPWRSAMTLPRELTLTSIDGKPYLGCNVIKEIDAIAGEWATLTPAGATLPDSKNAKAYQMEITADLSTNSTVTLSSGKDQYEIEIKGPSGLIIARRNAKTGQYNFNNLFSVPAVKAPILSLANTITLNIFIDQSSVEIISADGTTSITNLVFPASIYNSFSTTGGVTSCKARTLEDIWK